MTYQFHGPVATSALVNFPAMDLNQESPTASIEMQMTMRQQ